MATNYPSGLDSLSNPAGSDALSTGHASQHTNANDAIEAIEGELGLNPRGGSATVKARIDAIEANSWVTSARIADATITGTDIASGTITSTNILDGTITGTDIASGTVTSTNILDATILNADLADGAISPIKTSGGYVAKTALYTATNDDRVIDCTTGTYTITLPTAVSQAGRIFIVRNSGSGTITIGTTSSQTIDGAATIALAGKGFAKVVSNGSNWRVIAGQYADESIGRRIFTWNHAYSTGGGWQLTYSDTGWRDVSANINTPNGFTAGSIFVRRTGYTVALGVYGLARAAGGAGDYYTFLAGWRCDIPVYGRSFSNNPWYVNGSSAYINMAGTSESGAGTLFITSDAWPTSLPGSAIGTIPQ